MEKFKIPDEIVDEVEELIDIDREKTEDVAASSVIFDGKQYTLKIPKKIAETVGINPAKDKFIFQMTTYSIEQEMKPDLKIIFKRDDSDEERESPE